MSRPPRARGLKQVHVGRLVKREHVAPPAGAWIETRKLAVSEDFNFVAPPAGAWIETL